MRQLKDRDRVLLSLPSFMLHKLYLLAMKNPSLPSETDSIILAWTNRAGSKPLEGLETKKQRSLLRRINREYQKIFGDLYHQNTVLKDKVILCGAAVKWYRIFIKECNPYAIESSGLDKAAKEIADRLHDDYGISPMDVDKVIASKVNIIMDRMEERGINLE